MATRPVLVTILSRKTSYFGDETYSRHHFKLKNTFFGDETCFRHHFELKNTRF
ncbi:hypothetical protein LI012_18590 [Caldibacillus thermoamylovorans]|uniref:hypothetical protein n=1 Tax=Caldibacillus thermoamylovorans TaxID=35841 RepID=UPI001D06B104|nr:hypothetical protein [Caldibacillus thermoamylovorans]MCB5933540.1 hypothetical protein [Bacillus sp. DFI.2.34]MCB7078777.1 hypothetical protein [Caldibacillus thermoamylovorans]